jgi:hypothetical protein
VNYRVLSNVVDGSRDAILEFLFGRDPDVAEDGAGEFGKEALDRLSHEPCFEVKVSSKR